MVESILMNAYETVLRQHAHLAEILKFDSPQES